MAQIDDGVLVSFNSIRKRSLLLLGGGFLAATLAFAPAAVGTGTAAWAAPQPTAGLNYVALGDSYAVGLDLGPVVGAVPGCGQTSASYPQQLAAAFELDLVDMTCSGATTANVLSAPQSTGSGTNPIQSSELNADTDLVTLTIGGNDLGFSSIIGSCLAGSALGPLLLEPSKSNCKEIFTPGGVDSLAAAVAGPVTASLTTTLAKISELAPRARVFVVGYPALMPDTAKTPPGGCYVSFASPPNPFPFTNIDVAYLHGIQSQLDAAMSATADAAGVTFVPLLSTTLANTPCASNLGTAINGVTFDVGAMHPNTFGAGLMTTAAINAVQAAITAPNIEPGSTNFDLPVNAPRSLTFTTSGFPNPTLAASGQLPEGMTFNAATGVLDGTPTAPGISSFSLTATNSVDAVTQDYTLSVNQAPVITSPAPPASGTVGTPYTFTAVTASGYPTPTLELTGALPDGLTFTPATGVIDGTPTAPGSFSFGVTATNSVDTVDSPTYSVTIEAASIAPEITSANPPAAILGSEYSFTVKASGYPAPAFAITSGALPDGLSLDGVSGTISGTPTAAGSSTFTITASNNVDPAATAQYAIVVTKSADVNPPVTPPKPPVTPVTPAKPAVVTPVTQPKPALASTGSGSLVPLWAGSGIALLAGAGLLLARRTQKR